MLALKPIVPTLQKCGLFLVLLGATAAGSAASAQTLTTLGNFNGTDGQSPISTLIADGNGNLFGTTIAGGTSDDGTVFEITNSGFVPPKKFAGTPGTANCISGSVSAMAQTYGALAPAASTLGYNSVSALLSAVSSYCTQ